MKITAICESGHDQTLEIDVSLGRSYAEQLAGLMDGTSPMYIYKPGPGSVIGKCGICGKPFKCTIEAAV